MADGGVPIVLSPEPFARTTTYVEAPEGGTVRAMLASAISHGHLKLDDLPRTNVYVDGVRIDRDEALALVLVEGQIVNVVVEPLGGGGGGKKDIGQILLTIAVIAVSMWVGGPAGPLQAWPMLARQVAAAAILTAGQMAIAAIFKPESNVAKANDRYALSSASNQYRPWASMPMALGEVVVAPDLAVKTFTQAQGEDQWIYGILGLHYGPCTAEDLKIGDTLVSSMGAGDVRVAYHLTPGPRTFSIVPNDTDQLDLQEELQATVGGSTAVVRGASAEGERFEFDFFMPQGLYFAKDDGRKIAASLTVTIRYRPIDQNGVPTGSGAWVDGLTIPLSSASSDPWRIMRSLSLPLGRYEFEVKRSRLEDDNAKRKTDIGWTAIRAIAFRKPVLDETLSLIEFAVRASALNQGNLAPFTCRITPICETWTGTQWGAPVPTSNPAAITRWLMTGPAPAVALTKPQADVGLRTWAALCDQYNWKSHIYLTEDRKQDAVMQLLGMNGRASLFWDGTQLVSAPWVEKPAPRQLFAGSNLKDHRWEIVYPDPVHALRVEFQNIDQGGEADEIYVYADGYGETADPANNILPATLIEALRLEGQQTIERAYRDGRWNLGARLHQRRVDSWSTDIEHIVSRYGDRVRLAWDRVGTANATVRNRLWSGALVSGLRLSQPVRMEPGRAYALDLRLPDQVITGVPIVNPATTAPVVTRAVMFVDLRGANVTPRGGDLVAFGEPERISEDVEIIGITPGTDLTANMVGIRYVAPLLMAGETGPIPPLQSRLTRDRAMDPPMPTLLGWQANEEGVRIGFSMPPWRGSPITGFTLRWRQTPAAGQSSAWVPLPDLPANAMTAVTPPLRELPAEGTNVTSAQVQIVAVTADGRASPALQVTVQEAAIQQPPSSDWTVAELTEGPDGSRQSGFLVIGLVGSINPRRVTVEYGASIAGPWDAAFDGPPVQGVVRAPIMGMQPGAQCWIAITYWTAQASAPSERRVLGPYTAPGLVAGDLSPESPVIKRLDEIILDVEDLIETFGSTEAAAVSAAAADTARALAEAAKQAAIDAKTESAAQAVASQTARQGSETAAAASVASAQTSSSKADEAGQKAAAAEVARAAAETQRAQAEAARNTAVGAADTATGASASASSSATLAARLGFGQAMNLNPVFSQGWTNGQIPPGWQDWATGHNNGDNRRTGVESDNGLFLNVPGSGTVAAAARGVYQPSGAGSLGTAQSDAWYVQELTLKLVSGSLLGAGSHLQFADASGALIGSTNIDCKIDKPLGQALPGAGVAGQVYRYARLFKTVPGTKTIIPYAMGFWEGYWNVAPIAKDIVITKCLVRPATAGEIETGIARGSFTSVEARISAEELARTTENAAMAVRQSLTEARMVALPNLQPGSDYSEGGKYVDQLPAGGDYRFARNGIGSHVFIPGRATVGGDEFAYTIHRLVRVEPDTDYTLSWSGDGGSANGDAHIYFSQYDANDAYIAAGDGLGFTNFIGVNWDTGRGKVTIRTRPDAYGLKLILRRGPTTNYMAASRYMLNRGTTALNWSDDATTRNLLAQVKDNTGALVEQSGKLQAWSQKTVQAGDGKVFVEMRATDNNGNVTADILLGARRIGLLNEVGGGYLPALEAEGGRVKFAAPISIIQGGRRTSLGPGFGAGNDLHLWSGPSSIAYGGETIDNGILGISATDGFFGGKTLSGPFDTGVNGATVALPKNTWTTVASVDRGMQTVGYLMARASLSVLLGQANNDGDFTVQHRIAVTDLNGSNVVNIGGNFGSFAPNAWQTITGSLIEGAVNLASRGNKRVVLQINPTGSSIGSAQARNCQARGLYGA